MGTEVSTIQELLPLVEKYGPSVVLLFLFIIFACIQWRTVAKGELVPRKMLDHALEDNDRLQDILDKEQAAFTQPTLEVLQRLKADHSANSGNDEDRGGQPCGVNCSNVYRHSTNRFCFLFKSSTSPIMVGYFFTFLKTLLTHIYIMFQMNYSVFMNNENYQYRDTFF